MKVTLIVVASLDGRTTEGNKPGAGSWASPEDQSLFQAQMATHDRIVMGRKTYEAARSIITPEPDRLRIILTRTPQQFTEEEQPGLVFSAESPQAIVDQAKGDGCKSLLLVGGAETSAQFLNAGLVDELLVTIEPLLFGAGTPFVGVLQHTMQLQLTDHKQLNGRGTLLAHYIIQKG